MNDIKPIYSNFLDNKILKNISKYFLLLACSIYWANKNFLVYHTISELISVMITFLILITSLYHYELNKSNKLIILGIAFGFVSCFDLMHLFTYKGMGILADNNAWNTSTQLDIVGRFIESLSFLICFLLPAKEYNLKKIFFNYFFILVLVMFSIFSFNIFPECYIEGYGLTSFKIISQYVSCIILFIATIIFINQNYKDSNKPNIFIICSLILNITYGLLFAYYSNSTDIFSSIGHFLKPISFYLFYTALIKSDFNKTHSSLIEINNILEQKNLHLEKLIYQLKLEYEKSRRLEAENLRKSKILNAILEASISGILVKDNDNRIIHTNSLLASMWSLPYNKILNESYDTIIGNIEDQLENPEEFKLFMNKSIEGKHGYIYDLKLKDERIIEVSLFPLINKDIVTGKVISFRDITERYKIIELQKEIEIKQFIIEKAHEFDEAKTNFFSTVSHELRTPLNIILGVIQLLPTLNNNKEIFPEKYIKMMKQNCYRLIKLSNNLIDITKYDSGFMEIHLRNYNIVSIIEDITMSVVDYSNGKGITLTFDTEIEEEIIACDAEKLERVMLNLLSNAVKFVAPGGKIEVYIKK